MMQLSFYFYQYFSNMDPSFDPSGQIEKKILSLLGLVKANLNEKKSMEVTFALTGVKPRKRKGRIAIPKNKLPLSFIDGYVYQKYGESLIRFEDHIEDGIEMTALSN